MNGEKKKRNKIIGISIGILVVLLVVISSTYAYWQITKSQEGSNDIIAACLDIDMQSVDGTFEMNPAWPISDNEGMDLIGYKFKVTNKCPEDVNYVIGMDSLEVNDAAYLSYDSIKLSMDNSPAMIYGEQEDIEHIAEEDDNYVIRDSKKIATAIVKNGQPNEHIVKVWIKSDAPVEEQSRVFSGRMFITGGQNIENDKSLAKLIATGDISRTELCHKDRAEYICEETPGNDVDYYFYSDGTLRISGTGETKQFLKDLDTEQENHLHYYIIKKYIENKNIELTTEEASLLDNTIDFWQIAMFLYIDSDAEIKEMSGGQFSTVEEYRSVIAVNLGEEKSKLIFGLLDKLVDFPKITNVIIDDGVTSIGDNTFAFMFFDNLYMSDTVTEILDGSFSYGGFMKSYKFSENFATIEGGAFYSLMYTGSLKIPDTITKLNNILSNASISELILPNNESITQLEYNFVESMPNLTSLIIPENIDIIDYKILNYTNRLTLKFYGPERPIYKSAPSTEEIDLTQFVDVIWNYTEE